jgi:plasmid segregation protein ParM
MASQFFSKNVVNCLTQEGYGNIKTAHRVFTTGVESYDDEPIVSSNYVKYRDKYYVIGESHLVYQGNKTDSGDFYILTLAGLAEELKFRGLHEAEVVLAAGLPLAWVKSQAAGWREYLMKEKELDFMFQKERYKVHLCGVEIFPQGLAAVYNQGAMPGMNMLVDIGNGTMSLLEIHDGRPLEKSISTEVFGVHQCMEKIRKELSKQGGVDVPEMLIEPLLKNGIGERTDDVAEVTKKIAESYTGEIMKKLAAHGYKEGLVHLYVIGGGGCLLRHFSDLAEKENVTVISDICANAKGYEALAERKQCMKGRTA